MSSSTSQTRCVFNSDTLTRAQSALGITIDSHTRILSIPRLLYRKLEQDPMMFMASQSLANVTILSFRHMIVVLFVTLTLMMVLLQLNS